LLPHKKAQFKTDWFRDRLILDFEYTDRSRKTKIDTSISLGVTTTAIDNLKLSFHCLSDDKETKINFDVKINLNQNKCIRMHTIPRSSNN